VRNVEVAVKSYRKTEIVVNEVVIVAASSDEIE